MRVNLLQGTCTPYTHAHAGRTQAAEADGGDRGGLLLWDPGEAQWWFRPRRLVPALGTMRKQQAWEHCMSQHAPDHFVSRRRMIGRCGILSLESMDTRPYSSPINSNSFPFLPRNHERYKKSVLR